MSDRGQHDEPEKRRDRYQRAIAAGAGAGIGVIMAGPAGAIVGAALGPVLEPFAAKVWSEVGADGRRRGGEVLASACEALDCEPEILDAMIGTSDRTRLQAGIALSAAARTAYPPKVRVLGRALAAGLIATDDAKIDVQQLIMAALADIEAPQASLLELLACWQPGRTQDGFVAVPLTQSRYSSWGWDIGQRIWTTGQIGQARPPLRPVLSSLLRTLQRHGLAAQNDTTGDVFQADFAKARPGVQRAAGQARRHGKNAQPNPSFRNLASVAPVVSWSPTELGEQVIDALLEAGASFED